MFVIWSKDGNAVCFSNPKEAQQYFLDYLSECLMMNKTDLNEKKDWENIFKINLHTDELNTRILSFKNSFNKLPYLIMSESTLNYFSERTNEDDDNYVVCELDCEHYVRHAEYVMNRKTNKPNITCTIVIDNQLAFGVVKVR